MGVEQRQLHAIVTTVWAVGVLVHLLGNPAVAHAEALPSATGLVPVVLAVLAAGVALRPTSRPAALMAVFGVWVLALVRLPVLANNLVLLGVVGTALVISRDHRVAVRAVVRAGAAAYLFAAFAKYNTAFLDPATSCAPVILDRLVGSWGLGPLPRWMADASPVLALVTESAVGIGLLVPRLRRHAALLGVAFHGLLAYDLGQHFWDFTAALLPIFVAASPEVSTELARRARRLVPGRVARGLLLPLTLVAALTGAPVAYAWFILAGHVVWLLGGTVLVLGWVVVHVVLRPWGDAADDVPVGWPAGVAVLVALVVANGLTPYTQVKTGYGWNMYSNLRVVDDVTNHLVVPAIDLRGDHDDLLAVVDASDEGIAAYADTDALLPRVQLEDWVARTPGASVTATSPDGATVRLDHDTVVRSVPAWVVRFAPLRPVTDDCLLTYGRAG